MILTFIKTGGIQTSQGFFVNRQQMGGPRTQAIPVRLLEQQSSDDGIRGQFFYDVMDSIHSEPGPIIDYLDRIPGYVSRKPLSRPIPQEKPFAGPGPNTNLYQRKALLQGRGREVGSRHSYFKGFGIKFDRFANPPTWTLFPGGGPFIIRPQKRRGPTHR